MAGRRVALVVFVACLSVSTSARAHPTPGSVAYLDFTVSGVRIEQDVPIEELERALARQLAEPGERPEAMVARHADLLRAYARDHLRVFGARAGAPWPARVLDVAGHAAGDGPRARFRFLAQAPESQASQSIQLRDEIVAHEVVSHYLTVYVRSDWAEGAVITHPRLVGVIHAGHHQVSVSRDGTFWRGLLSIVRLGSAHIMSGTDHLMFLFALVLVAPVSAAQRRWQTRRTPRDTLVTLAGVVSAFTVGHSATLALGAFGWFSLPSVFVESAIAASILVTAVHALRPLFPGREAVVAGAFGLVHGLAFADTLDKRDLGPVQTAWTLLGFNTGIELAQLALLLLALPWLLILARTRLYQGFRVVAAWVACGLATGWLLERTLGVDNPTAHAVAWLEGHALYLLLALAITAVVARAADSAPHA